MRDLGENIELLANEQVIRTVFEKSAKPMIMIGQAAFSSESQARFVYSALGKLSELFPALIKDGWNGISFLQPTSSRTTGLDLGIVPGVRGNLIKHKNIKPKVVFLLGADEYDANDVPDDAFVIYQGHHGDRGAQRADIVLPSTTFVEKSGIYVNTEGRVQVADRVIGGPEDARDDWEIIRALSEIMKKTLPYNSVDDVRNRIMEIAPHFASMWEVEQSSIGFHEFKPEESESQMKLDPLKPLYDNYWTTDPIARNSIVLSKCSKRLPNATNSYA